jgi:hypothetical protein
MSENIIYEKLIHENLDKGLQLKLIVNEFRGQEYIHIRYYYLSFDEGWLPSKDGISIPMNIESVYALTDGLVEILSKEEILSIVNRYSGNKQTT